MYNVCSFLEVTQMLHLILLFFCVYCGFSVCNFENIEPALYCGASHFICENIRRLQDHSTYTHSTLWPSYI